MLFSLFSCLAQVKSEPSNYYFEVLSAILKDIETVSKFNLVKNDNLDNKIIVVVPKDYLFQEEKINNSVVIIGGKELACQYLNRNETKTIIVLSEISVSDTAAKFIIPVTYYELKKNKKECIWKIFLGGNLLSPEKEYPYFFIFNTKLEKWEMGDASN